MRDRIMTNLTKTAIISVTAGLPNLKLNSSFACHFSMTEASRLASSANPKAPNPSGLVLGPDGKPCKPCTAFRDWRKSQRPASTNSTSKADQAQQSTAAMMAAFAAGTGTGAGKPQISRRLPDPDIPPAHCPPDVEQLGQATWAFLHSAAAYYPERPTPHQRANMLNLLHALPVLYPCSHCASDFGEKIKQHPPDVSGQRPLSRWLCERHNEVNEKLGKESFDCHKTDERWRDGPEDGSCD
ncbi:ERV/ALR sulfhydryl oxidase domain-containing protein [Hygrophoropsis aurantiaca]|uniref:ERV/ALR sulfhydryl oxidase domain-containing protein n=1 Tax=Hygrophoropsis aurantiaca TaxID=72124 RepID=A0ACB8A7E6_9AGAM|nr:ERV/ALR sulfhydryl oxidase domain-containing protein [Hygrophoropsis aurantiaca]